MVEAQQFCYEEETLPQIKSTAIQLLSGCTVFWEENPYSSKTPIQSATSLDFKGMDKHAKAHMLLIKPLVVAQLRYPDQLPQSRLTGSSLTWLNKLKRQP